MKKKLGLLSLLALSFTGLSACSNNSNSLFKYVGQAGDTFAIYETATQVLQLKATASASLEWTIYEESQTTFTIDTSSGSTHIHLTFSYSGYSFEIKYAK